MLLEQGYSVLFRARFMIPIFLEKLWIILRMRYIEGANDFKNDSIIFDWGSAGTLD